jgi:2-polyprenyl-3-methyl-5-hydroxy-6-metoxy-1,4-benzoquinol methylase
MTTEPLYADTTFARYYDLANGWTEDNQALATLAADASTILDLGCGTGLLATHLATQGKQVTGVEPAEGMLDIARTRPGGARVTWLQEDARTLRLGRRFDLIIMAGHAFQCLLTPEDQLSLLTTIAHHLSPQGRFIFDSRNPTARAWEGWTPDQTRRSLPDGTLMWHDATHDDASQITTYTTTFAPPDARQITTTARIAFPTQPAIAQACTTAGLHVTHWHGDWHLAPFTPQSPEIIALGTR